MRHLSRREGAIDGGQGTQPPMSGSATRAVEVFYDGGCPVCLREVRLLRRLDRRGSVLFTDIDEPGFEPPRPGPAFDDLMARIHARLPDGSWIQGVEVFRRLYTAVGFGPLVAVSRWPGISHLLDGSYAVFARNRVRWFGRCTTNTCAVDARRV